MMRKRQSPESVVAPNGGDADLVPLASPLLDDEECALASSIMSASSADAASSALLPSREASGDRRQPSFADGFQPASLAFKECFVYFLFYLGVGVGAYSFVFEEWTVIDSLYFSVTTFSECSSTMRIQILPVVTFTHMS